MMPGSADRLYRLQDSPSLLEPLEARLLLAGDVAAAVINGHLVLTGDHRANEIIIDQTGLAANEFRIRSGADATTVNGENEVIVAGVTGDVRANLRRGDDVLEIVDAVVAGDLIVRGRRGKDTVTVTGKVTQVQEATEERLAEPVIGQVLE